MKNDIFSALWVQSDDAARPDIVIANNQLDDGFLRGIAIHKTMQTVSSTSILCQFVKLLSGIRHNCIMATYAPFRGIIFHSCYKDPDALMPLKSFAFWHKLSTPRRVAKDLTISSNLANRNIAEDDLTFLCQFTLCVWGMWILLFITVVILLTILI